MNVVLVDDLILSLDHRALDPNDINNGQSPVTPIIMQMASTLSWTWNYYKLDYSSPTLLHTFVRYSLPVHGGFNDTSQLLPLLVEVVFSQNWS